MPISKKYILPVIARVILVVFCSNLAFAYKPEENIWEERSTQLASLPANMRPAGFHNLNRPQIQ